MISHPAAIGSILVLTAAGLVLFSGTRAGKSLFRFLPVPFYCYFIPIVLATAGVLPNASPVYKFFSQHVLPPCLVLLLLGSPWGELWRLGRQAILSMGIGSIGMVLGAAVAYRILVGRLPADSWMAAGALLGSWTGGSANMMAVKEALSMPESLLAPIIIVDTVMAYGWMAILIAMAGYQSHIDLVLNADRRTLDGIRRSTESSDGGSRAADGVRGAGLVILAAVIAGEGALWLGSNVFAARLPILSGTAWAVILATLIGLILSVTPARRWEDAGASKIGTRVLLLLLTSYGAQTNLRAIAESPAFMAFGAVMVAVHGFTLALFGRLLRLPLFYLATASQACIGGPVSTPIVAGVYQPTLTHVGVILALIGGAVGTYVGLFGAILCKWIFPG